ncbi:aquaporin-9-like [Oppia nitens]|uniref:aquaporin-9-like n=1 Tax=Oppia nitens TaxID=1686743 RepID=UPI0023DCC3E7|nr:aquaporin-9-like [Oppia nitens]
MKIFKVNKTNNENDLIHWKCLLRELLAEFIGTFMLMLIGCSAGVTTSNNPKNDPNFRSDLWSSNICWGFGAFVGLCASFNITGGHINPAVSIAMATIGKFQWKKVMPYILAQILAAIIAPAIIYYVYIDVIELQNNHILIRNNTQLQTYGHNLSTGKFFATYPQEYVTLFGSIIDQVVGTASLLFSVCAVTDEKNLNIPKPLQPFCLAFVITCHAIAFNSNEGAPLNPARDLGPRIFSAMVIYGKHAFTALNGNYWWSGGIVGPVIGAIVGVWTYFFFIELPWPKDKCIDNINSETLPQINTVFSINNDIEKNNHNNQTKSQF